MCARSVTYAPFLKPSLQTRGWLHPSGSALCGHAIALAMKLVQRRQIRLGRSHDDVQVGAYAVDHPSAMLQANGHLTLGFCASRSDGIHGIEQHFGATLHLGLDGLQARIDRAVAIAL